MTSLGGPSRPSEPVGTLFNIQRFSLHDGPGIRTVVFLKGCPLACRWCSNPESQSPQAQVLWHAERCLHCGRCLEACPRRAIRESAGSLVTDPQRCTACGSCVAGCPWGAREMAGFRRTVPEVLAEVLRDRPFYASSGGGLTLSGGEPAAQAGFCLALLDRASHAGVHGAMETAGCCAPETFADLARACALVLFDLKTADAGRFREQTGGELGTVLENLSRLDRNGRTPYIVRIPLVPGFNTDPESLDALAGRLEGLERLQSVHLLPYHRLGASKYPLLNRRYELAGVRPLDGEALELARRRFAGLRVPVQCGG